MRGKEEGTKARRRSHAAACLTLTPRPLRVRGDGTQSDAPWLEVLAPRPDGGEMRSATVPEWLAAVGLSEYAELFEQNRIEVHHREIGGQLELNLVS